MRKASAVKLEGMQKKIKIDLDTADFRRQQAEIRTSMLEMRQQKLQMSIDTSKAKSELTGFQAFANSLLGKITFGNLLATGITAGISMIQNALQGLVQTFKESLNVASQYEISLKGLSSVSRAFGQSQDSASNAAKSLASDGLLPLNQATQTLKNLISTGYSLDESFTLANALKNIGAFNNNLDDLGLAMETSSRGFRTNSIELIDNIGLTERLSSILKKAGVDVSQGIALTESATQRQAVYNAVLKEAQKFNGDAAAYTETYSGKIAQLNNSVKEMQNSFGEFITGPGINFVRILKLEADSLKIVLDYIKEINEENAIRNKGNFILADIKEKGGVKALNKDEIAEYMGIFETRWAEGIKKNGSELKKVYDELAQRQYEITVQTKGSSSDAKDKARRQQQKEIQDNQKAYDEYFNTVKNQMSEIDKRGKDYGKTAKDIASEKIRYLESEADKVGVTSVKYQDLMKILKPLQNVVKNFQVDDEAAKELEKINKQLDEIEFKIKDYNIYKMEIDVEYNAKPDMENVPLEQSGYGKLPTAGSTGIDYGSYYGKIQQDAINTQKETDAEKLKEQKIANNKFLAEQQDYYKTLTDDQIKMLNEAKQKIASEISSIGAALNNDFISALGSFAQGVLDIASEIQSYKAAKSTIGMLGQISAGLGIVGTVVSFASSLLGNSGKIQMTAAEKMEKAVSEFKAKIEGMTVQEISSEGEILAQRIASVPEGAIFDGIRHALQAQLDTIAPAIKDALNITWQDFANSVKSAFDADNLEDFYSTFKKNLSESIKDSLVTAFLQSTAMKTMFEGLSTDIFNALAGVGFDASKITSEQAKEWQVKMDELSKSGGAFYEVLQMLGLAGKNTADALNSAANTINSIPEGVKVSLYRYQSMTPLQNASMGTSSSVLPNISVYIGNEKIQNLVTKVNMSNNVKEWGA